VPSARALADGTAPQLPIEAWLLEQGAFADAAGTATELTYWRLTGGEVPGEVTVLGATAPDGRPYAEIAEERLRDLAARWLLGQAPFLSRPHPARAAAGGDYDHLARVEEWSSGAGEE
jgi:ATP-dependent helicase/nuclease subunit B